MLFIFTLALIFYTLLQKDTKAYLFDDYPIVSLPHKELNANLHLDLIGKKLYTFQVKPTVSNYQQSEYLSQENDTNDSIYAPLNDTGITKMSLSDISYLPNKIVSNNNNLKYVIVNDFSNSKLFIIDDKKVIKEIELFSGSSSNDIKFNKFDDFVYVTGFFPHSAIVYVIQDTGIINNFTISVNGTPRNLEINQNNGKKYIGIKNNDSKTSSSIYVLDKENSISNIINLTNPANNNANSSSILPLGLTNSFFSSFLSGSTEINSIFMNLKNKLLYVATTDGYIYLINDNDKIVKILNLGGKIGNKYTGSKLVAPILMQNPANNYIFIASTRSSNEADYLNVIRDDSIIDRILINGSFIDIAFNSINGNTYLLSKSADKGKEDITLFDKDDLKILGVVPFNECITESVTNETRDYDSLTFGFGDLDIEELIESESSANSHVKLSNKCIKDLSYYGDSKIDIEFDPVSQQLFGIADNVEYKKNSEEETSNYYYNRNSHDSTSLVFFTDDNKIINSPYQIDQINKSASNKGTGWIKYSTPKIEIKMHVGDKRFETVAQKFQELFLLLMKAPIVDIDLGNTITFDDIDSIQVNITKNLVDRIGWNSEIKLKNGQVQDSDSFPLYLLGYDIFKIPENLKVGDNLTLNSAYNDYNISRLVKKDIGTKKMIEVFEVVQNVTNPISIFSQGQSSETTLKTYYDKNTRLPLEIITEFKNIAGKDYMQGRMQVTALDWNLNN